MRRCVCMHMYGHLALVQMYTLTTFARRPANKNSSTPAGLARWAPMYVCARMYSQVCSGVYVCVCMATLHLCVNVRMNHCSHGDWPTRIHRHAWVGQTGAHVYVRTCRVYIYVPYVYDSYVWALATCANQYINHFLTATAQQEFMDAWVGQMV